MSTVSILDHIPIDKSICQGLGVENFRVLVKICRKKVSSVGGPYTCCASSHIVRFVRKGKRLRRRENQGKELHSASGLGIATPKRDHLTSDNLLHCFGVRVLFDSSY